MPPEMAPLDSSVAGLVGDICEQARRACLQAFAHGVRSIILIGSLARNEGTFVSAAGGSELIGDAEFVVVLRDEVRLPSGVFIADLCRRVESALLQAGLKARISAAVVHDRFLRRMTPHMFAFELRTCGVVIWGEPRVLELVPRFAASEISLEDAWWTLCNRSIEALEAIAVADTDQPRVPRDVFYRVVKLYLDMATSLLLFIGGYEPGYARRSQRLSSLAAQGAGTADIPLPLPEFSREVAACTNWKLAPDESFERSATWGWCMSALAYAARLWRWELLQLTGASDTNSSEQLMANWMRRQPLARRLRGWLYVWRECGWLHSLPHWLHWARLARRGSPRYWIYAALGDLLPQAVGGAGAADARLQRWWESLPLATGLPAQPDGPSWLHVAKDIGRNYHVFLEHTRS
jgi:hypothetical protein